MLVGRKDPVVGIADKTRCENKPEMEARSCAAESDAVPNCGGS